MNKLFNFILITALLFSACSKTPVIELPVTTSSPKALEYYKRAMDYYLTTDFPEGWAMLDSALVLHPQLVLIHSV
jgi:hypothetical protein